MSSPLSKLKSKIKSRNSIEAQTMQCFDETALEFKVSCGKSQLQKIKIECFWTNKSISIKPPTLICNWYNKTEKNLTEVVGVYEDVYQPCVEDVGSIIRVECQPKLEGIEYEGMPIFKEIGPIKLAQDTQEEVTQLFDARKAKFFVSIKEVKMVDKQIEQMKQGLICLEENCLSLLKSTFGYSNSKELKKIEINQQFPKTVLNRSNTKQITIIFNKEEYCIVEVQNHQIRDVLCCLIYRFIVFSESLKKEIKKQSKEVKEQPKNQSSSNIIQIMNLTNQLKQSEQMLTKLKKELDQKNGINEELSIKVEETFQRSQNLSINYFNIEKELKEAQKLQKSSHQQNLYNKKQAQLLKAQNEKLKKLIEQLKETNKQYQTQLSKFSSQKSEMSYGQLQSMLSKMKIELEESKMKLNYCLEEKERYDDLIRNSRMQVEEIEAERNHIEKKFSALSMEITSSPNSKINKFSEYSEQKSYKSSKKSSQLHIDKEDELRQIEILSLKKEIKNLIQQNNFLKTVKMKEKKASSKQQLKMELFQIRKLSNRLAEAITDKDMALDQLRFVNKQLNMKIMELEKIIAQNQMHNES